ncbi:MAG TPA: PEP-CTERM sorting domain-containing protein, partial [Thermoguttaceae bacterium]|nr:PEP-CTERM sorting domain-containing protein [Thermoguttaceae bacterium]
LFILPSYAQAEWLYNWVGGGPTGNFGTASDIQGDASPWARDIRAYAQYSNSTEDSRWNIMAALYAVTNRAELYQAFRLDLKGIPGTNGYADYYVVAIDGVPGEGTSLFGQTGIDRLIISPYVSGTGLTVPLLYTWTGSGFDAGTPFTAIPGSAYQYGEGNKQYPLGSGYTLEWKLPIGYLGTGPFTIVGATAGGNWPNFTVYDMTSGIDLGAASIIPEPSSLALLGLGALGFLGYLLRRRG